MEVQMATWVKEPEALALHLPYLIVVVVALMCVSIWCTRRARLAERKRIARELHDSVLQSAPGLILQLQSILDRMDDGCVHRELLLRAASTAEALLAECSDQIFQLRSANCSRRDLPAALERAVAELASSSEVTIKTSVTGPVLSLKPETYDAVFHIGLEAIRNALTHAEATIVEVRIDFSARSLRLCVRDNGKGFEPRLSAQHTETGHWGLNGMNERAEEMGARLLIHSQRGLGTVIELSVPSSTAYATALERRRHCAGAEALRC